MDIQTIATCHNNRCGGILTYIFRSSSAVEQPTVNRRVTGSIPVSGAKKIKAPLAGVFIFLLCMGRDRTGKGSGKREFSRGGAHEPMGLWERIPTSRDERREIAKRPCLRSQNFKLTIVIYTC